MFEKVSQADKGLVAVASPARASVNSGISLFRMIHRKLQVCLKQQWGIKDPKAREACVAFVGLWTCLRKMTGGEPGGLGVDEDSGVIALSKKPEDAMVVQARSLRADSVLEVRHQDTGLLESATAERAEGREGSMDTRSEVLYNTRVSHGSYKTVERDDSHCEEHSRSGIAGDRCHSGRGSDSQPTYVSLRRSRLGSSLGTCHRGKQFEADPYWPALSPTTYTWPCEVQAGWGWCEYLQSWRRR